MSGVNYIYCLVCSEDQPTTRQIKYEVLNDDGRSEYSLQGTIVNTNILQAIENGLDPADRPVQDDARYYYKEDLATKLWYMERFTPKHISFGKMNTMMFVTSSNYQRQPQITGFIDDVLDQALDTEDGHLRAARILAEYPAASFFDDKQTEYRLYRFSDDQSGQASLIIQYVLFVATLENPRVSIQYSFIGEDEDLLRKIIAQKVQMGVEEIIVNNVE